MPAGTRWTTPTGGFFTWLTLPEGGRYDDASQALAPAIDNGVVFVPGTAFHDDPTMGRTPGTDPAGGAVDDAGTRPGARNLRLAFSSVAPDRLTEGVRRLAEVL